MSMHTTKKFWLVLAAAILGMAIIACSCGSFLPRLISPPTPTSAPPATVAPVPTDVPMPTDVPVPTDIAVPTVASLPTSVTSAANPLPALAGYWQTGSIVFTIEWLDGKYAVTAVNAAGTSTRTLEDQSWDGNSLTWTYTYSDENGDSSITYSTAAVDGDTLLAYRSTAAGGSDQRLLRRIASALPAYDNLPYSDDFSDPGSGWDIYNSDNDSAGYVNATYFVISKTNQYTSFGSAGKFFGDSIIDVDAIPASGPADNNFSYNVSCREQANYDGYIFEIGADGYYAVGYYTGGGQDYVSLLSGDDWQPSSAIQPGNATNHIKVTCAGSQLKLEVNGLVLFEGQDSTFTEGDISLGAGTFADDNFPAEVHFDNLMVNRP
jgi:hypothetical protein